MRKQLNTIWGICCAEEMVLLWSRNKASGGEGRDVAGGWRGEAEGGCHDAVCSVWQRWCLYAGERLDVRVVAWQLRTENEEGKDDTVMAAQSRRSVDGFTFTLGVIGF
ncbi:hypothetical protein SESBI_43892 [Sesbania bispinosa]|nr:hypothetical protein SESBI_43892 [Sesbania bispinosa]